MNALKKKPSPQPSDSAHKRPIRIILMSKLPIPNHVKTRLAADTSPFFAALAHQAMLQTCVHRFSHFAASNHHIPLRLNLALTDGDELDWADLVTQTPINTQILRIPPSHNPRDQHIPTTTLLSHWNVIDQGSGNLGDRLKHVWSLAPNSPVILLATDSPDLPLAYLSQAISAIQNQSAGIGPVSDGGYYALAAPRFLPQLLENIDWSTSSVYDQTLRNAKNASIPITTLPQWYDIDTKEDLDALYSRLEDTTDPSLTQLQNRLTEISGILNHL